MNKSPSDLRIVFMGTPDFAVPTLEKLVSAGLNVVGVITAVDKLGGRGRKWLLQSAVKKYALSHRIPVIQPKNLKRASFIDLLTSLRPDLQIVVAFRMLPEVVWSLPPMGTINLHASLLPAYRGAAPINWAIIRGEKMTGLTTFFIQKEIDTGRLLKQVQIPIHKDDTAGSLHDRMMHAGATLVHDTIVDLCAGQLEPKEQDHSQATGAPKIFKDSCEIDFTQSCASVYDFVRGLSPYPTARTRLDGVSLKIYAVKCTDQPSSHLAPGQVVSDGRTFLRMACIDTFVEVLDLQLEGRKRMDSQTFLNGYKISSTLSARK